MNGPYLLEVLLGRGTPNRRWSLQQACDSPEEAMDIVSRMSSIYEFRLYCGPAYGYAPLEWVDDPDDADLCVPRWGGCLMMPSPA